MFWAAFSAHSYHRLIVSSNHSGFYFYAFMVRRRLCHMIGRLEYYMNVQGVTNKWWYLRGNVSFVFIGTFKCLNFLKTPHIQYLSTFLSVTSWCLLLFFQWCLSFAIECKSIVTLTAKSRIKQVFSSIPWRLNPNLYGLVLEHQQIPNGSALYLWSCVSLLVVNCEVLGTLCCKTVILK